MTNNTITNELTGQSRVQTDHGDLDFGDLVVLIFDLVLLIYTGWRSFDFLSTTVPAGWQMLALVGLWGLDIGAIGWSLVWIFGSTEKYQDWTAMTFFVIDLLGVVLTSVTDSLMYGAKDGAMTSTLTGVATVGIPLIIVGNVVAGFVYHMTSPKTKARREARKKDAEYRIKMKEISDMERDLLHAESYLLAKQDVLDKSVLLAEIKTAQDVVEKATREKLRDQIGLRAESKGVATSTSANSLGDGAIILKNRLQELTRQLVPPSPSQTDLSPSGHTQEPSKSPSPELHYHPEAVYQPAEKTPLDVPQLVPPITPPSSLVVLQNSIRFASKLACVLNQHTINPGDELEAVKKADGNYFILSSGDSSPLAQVSEENYFLLRNGVPFNDPGELAEPALVKNNGHKPESPT